MDENFDTRRRIYNLPRWQIDQIEAARACGASAQFAGSGGAIVGVYRDAEMLAKVRSALEAIGSHTIVPQITG
jgi:glucuronokinase